MPGQSSVPRNDAATLPATGELQGVTGIDDPRFNRLVRQMVPLLFPPIDPTRDDHDMRFLITKGRLGGFLG